MFKLMIIAFKTNIQFVCFEVCA